MRRLQSYGLSAGMARAIEDVFTGAQREQLAAAIGSALAEQKKTAGSPPAVEARDRLAAEVALAEHLRLGFGVCRASRPLGRFLAETYRGDVGLYGSDETRTLVTAASLRASNGYTTGHDCWFRSVGSITGQTPDAIGQRLQIHTDGYRSEDWRTGKWRMGDDLVKLGLSFRRLGDVYSDVRFEKVRVLPEIVGFFDKNGDPAQQALAAMNSHPVGSRFVVGITGHVLHAVRLAEGAVFLESQTLSGRTLVVPAEALAANADKLPGLEVTLVGGDTRLPPISRVGIAEFLRDSPWAWERVPE